MSGRIRFDRSRTGRALPDAPEPGPLEAHLRAVRDTGRKMLVPYLTGGLPGWLDAVRAAADAGVDAVEIGIPFSDPAMDGPVIQAASEAALRSGVTPDRIFDDIAGLDIDVPIIAMTYYNLAFRMGDTRFAGTMADAGFSGIILPDVPVEEQGPWRAAADPAGIETILLAGPITPDDRLRLVCEHTRGYLYGVNLMGITGERESVSAASAVLAGRLKAITDVPVLMGFGVSTPEQAVEVASAADGVIVGTAFVRRMLEGVPTRELHSAIAAMRTALDA